MKSIINIYIYLSGTCLSFILGASSLQKKALSNQNKGHLGSRYVYYYFKKNNSQIASQIANQPHSKPATYSKPAQPKPKIPRIFAGAAKS